MTAGRLLGRVLRAAGIDAVYGERLPGVEVIPVGDPGIARLLAAAHRRVHRSQALSHGARVLGEGPPIDVDDPADLIGVTDHLAAGGAICVTFDLQAPAPDIEPDPVPGRGVVEPGDDILAALASATAPIVLAGPGVVAGGAVAGLQAFAAAGSVGVLNTWGAKGVFDWRSPHHLATAGLQQRDFELGGVTGSDLVVATGVDLLEAPAHLWRMGPVVEVPPAALGALASRWSRPTRDIEVPPLRAGLAAVTQEGWASTAVPMAPTLVTRNYGILGFHHGLLAADPDLAGYWVARTFATTQLGGVHVPAEGNAIGFAAAACLVARLREPGRPVLAVAERPPVAILEVARTLGVPIPVEVWAPDGDTLDADAHLDRLSTMLRAERPTVATLATDPTQLDQMIDVAGPIIAWT